ncbi:Sulfotransferase [Methylocella tundrae]|uniref:Sulfotransferase n=1 Tax=Methylocella tundrae TaxID=227605 RepID=A0A8B6MBH4_METTU|nr:sulfotransferase domain-containing protein [Methylocella tundrae]VTZ26627.1 Sulfotransferase [Methylocella tundrae]VTZ51428.1 Sulfotransferase [Methylocella tundrae]
MSLFGKVGAYLQALRHQDPLPEGFTPISECRADDLFIVGYPKSGNTWFQNLIAGVAFGVDPRWSPPALVHELVPDVHYNKHYRRYATPMFFKSHALPRPDYRRVVYLLRDGRDVMVSYRHYREVVDGEKLDLLNFVSPETDLYPCHWNEHVDAWAQNPHGAEIIVIKYEDLLREPVRQLQRFCEFAGLQRDVGHLSAVAAASSFRQLRDKEAKMGFGRTDHTFESGPFFFRRGVAGSHKDEMPADALKLFMDQARSTLQRFGYLVNSAECVQETLE